MTERRRFLRFEAALSALCNIVSEKYKEKCRIKNISKEGALVVMEKRLREGDQLNIAMDVPGDNVPIFASCQVAWQGKAKKSDAYETGVKFTNLNNVDKLRLLEHLYTQWLKFLDDK